MYVTPFISHSVLKISQNVKGSTKYNDQAKVFFLSASLIHEFVSFALLDFLSSCYRG